MTTLPLGNDIDLQLDTKRSMSSSLRNMDPGFLKNPASTTVPLSLMKTQDDAISFLDKYVREDEDAADLSLIYYPILGLSFESEMISMIQYSMDKSNTCPVLEKWLSVGKLWLSKFAAAHIANVSANVRNRLAEFEQRELDGVIVGTRTFVLRRGVDRLIAELDHLLRFIYRFPTTIFDEFKSENITSASDLSLIELAIIPKILVIAVKEEPMNHEQLPIACRYCLSRGFSLKRENTLTMNECGWFASRISTVMHLLRAGVCGYLVTLKVSSQSQCLTMREMDFVQNIQHGRVTNLLAPYIKRLRDMNARKPPLKNNTVNSDGDITSGSFTFAKTVWSTLISRLTKIANVCFEKIFDGTDWNIFLCNTISVVDWVHLDVFVTRNEQRIFLKNLVVKTDIQGPLERLQEIMELSLFGLGAGAVRHEEICRVNVSLCQWHNNYVYFWTRSLKKASLKGSSAQGKLVEHRLSLSISKIFLLSRYAMSKSQYVQVGDLFPQQSNASMIRLVRDIFELDYSPQMLNVRHLFTSIGNILIPDGNKEASLKSVVSKPALTFKSGHTQETGIRSYATWIENSDEMIYDFYHKSLGETCLEPPQSTFVPFASETLLAALRQFIGHNFSWRTEQQRDMVFFFRKFPHTTRPNYSSM